MSDPSILRAVTPDEARSFDRDGAVLLKHIMGAD